MILLYLCTHSISLSVTLHPPATPVSFKDKLKNAEALEGGVATLRCELNKPAPVEWVKGQKTLRPGSKYRMKKEGAIVELTIHDLDLKDAGDYTCISGDQQTAAVLTVNGKKSQIKAQLCLSYGGVPTPLYLCPFKV